jgi:hypothetical protein
LCLDPRPLIEIPLQPRGPNRSVRQSMRWQHREAQTAWRAKITLDPLLQHLLRLSIAPVTAMLAHRPRTATRTDRALSSELIFSKLNRGAFAKSRGSIKQLYFELHRASPTLVRANVTDPRSRRNPQRYRTRTKRGRNKGRKRFGESLRRRRTPNKTEELYAAEIRPKVQRHLHMSP